MKVYLVSRTDDADYDEAVSAVVVANTAKEAREIAKTTHGDQSPDVWNSSTVRPIGIALNKYREPAVIHTDHKAG